MSLDVYLSIEVDTGGPEPRTFHLYDANITHNLNTMADKAGIYEAMWRPDEIEAKVAGDIITLLQDGLDKLRDDPEYYQRFNPENGWGSYEGLLEFVDSYLAACMANPAANLRISR